MPGGRRSTGGGRGSEEWRPGWEARRGPALDLASLLLLLLLPSAHLNALPTHPEEPPLPPSWAFTVNDPDAPPTAQDDGRVRMIAGSPRGFTLARLRDPFSLPDRHPHGQPPGPPAVTQGRRPENASLAGLPAACIVQQMEDDRNGLRRSSEPRMGPPANMLNQATAATEEETREAAGSFAALPIQRWIPVVEVDSIPAMHIAGWMHVPVEGRGMEPLGEGILETPEDPEGTALRDASAGFVAWVPRGRLTKGERLVRTGADGRSQPCAICHGEDLRGLGPLPGLAGRSPSYMVRQLWDLKYGARHGRRRSESVPGGDDGHGCVAGLPGSLTPGRGRGVDRSPCRVAPSPRVRGIRRCGSPGSAPPPGKRDTGRPTSPVRYSGSRETGCPGRIGP